MAPRSHREAAPEHASAPSTLCRFSNVATLPLSVMIRESGDVLILLAGVGADKAATSPHRTPAGWRRDAKLLGSLKITGTEHRHGRRDAEGRADRRQALPSGSSRQHGMAK